MYASIDLVASRLVSKVKTLHELLGLLVHMSTCQTHRIPLVMRYVQARKLRKYKERRLDGYHGGPNMGENLAEVLNSIEVDDSDSGSDDELIDPEQTVVTKIKR